MINSIELGNFLSHSDTKLNFEKGVTVFVGHNGSGKSSIIDAITFALFGQHTRKSNKGLIRRGQNQGFAKINFSINNIEYQATRIIDSKGTLKSQFLEKKGNDWSPIAEGERKQFGESMTKKIESYIGLDFEKLKIASIVRQGELSSIIKAKPKEFKELINAIIGIDKLDTSSEIMRILLKQFRETIQSEIGYDDTHVESLKNELEKIKKEINEMVPLKEEFLSKKEILEKKIKELKKEIENQSYNLEWKKELEVRKMELAEYAKNVIVTIQKEITEKERKIRDCEACFEQLEAKKIVEKSLKMAESSLKEISKTIQDFKIKLVSLKEKKEFAQKLHLEDGRCPVCDSKVEQLNPLFQEKHLDEEILMTNQKIGNLEKQDLFLNGKKNEFEEKLDRINEAEAILRAHDVKNIEEIVQIKQEVTNQRTVMQKIPITVNSGKLVEISSLDSHAQSLYEKIVEMENKIKRFDLQKFENLKDSLDIKQKELSKIDQQLGGILEKIRKGKEDAKKFQSSLQELFLVKEYVSDLEEIQENVFNRDGPVATSLRSWALKTISSKASEYLSILNTNIQRIELKEKTRDISISCYSKKTMLDLESLSGGEQVGVALSLRLGMAQLLGSSNLNFIILDEPTTHLDEERRKSLVKVLSQLSDISSSVSNSSMQFIIITHDSDIFEDSSVEHIYKFEASEKGTIVNLL